MWWRRKQKESTETRPDGETKPRTALVLLEKTRLTARDAADLQGILRAAIDRAERVIVDLARVEIMTTAVIATLLVEQGNAEHTGKSVELVGLSTAAKVMFDLSNTQDAFTTYATLEEALALGVARQQTAAVTAVGEPVKVAHLQLTCI